MSARFKYNTLKKRIRFVFFHLIILSAFSKGIFAQVGVNILTPHRSSAMQIESPIGTAKGLLTPTMTTSQRMTITTGTNVAADGLVVYDNDHHMHYYYNGMTHRWHSMSPLSLSTPTVGSSSVPSGVITTPSSSATFSFGINKQNPSQALDVVGNTTVSGNINAGGNMNVAGSTTLTGNTTLNGTVTVPGFPTNAFVPQGIIVMWSGTVVPVGWGLCDGGTYGGLVTPDLRGRFIVGVDHYPGTISIATGQHLVYGQSGLTPPVAPNDGTTVNYGTIGNTGGENGHTLSIPEMPLHNHGFNDKHNIDNPNGNEHHFFYDQSSYLLPDSPSSTNKITNDTGGSQVHENRPPYYVLAYIIKLP